MGASQWTTATVSGRPSPSRSPDACFFTTCCTGPQSKGNSTPAGSGGAPCAGALLVCGPGLWAAVAEPGWNSDDSATTPARAVAVATQWIGRACVWASSGTAEGCTRSASCEGCAGGGGQHRATRHRTEGTAGVWVRAPGEPGRVRPRAGDPVGGSTHGRRGGGVSAGGAAVGVGARVVLAVGALGGAAAAHGRLDAVGGTAGGEQEAGVADHPVVRADGQALDGPVADHRLPGGRLVEAADLADGLHGPGELGGGRHVAAQDAAGDERLGDGLQALPGGQHVEDDAVHVGVGQVVLEVADGELPGGVRAAEVAL